MPYTLDELREELARAVGPWLTGTTTGNVGRKTLVDSALLALNLEDDAWKGAFARVELPSGVWEERRIIQYTAGTPGFLLHPELNATPSAGTRYEVHLRSDGEAYHWAINRAIADARPEIYEPMVAAIPLTTQLLYNLPAEVDDLIGLEVESTLDGEGYRPVPTEQYTVQQKTAIPTGSFQWELFGTSSPVYVTLRRALPAGRWMRVHYRMWYPPLTAGTHDTYLDHDYVLWQAEAHLRRHWIGLLQGTAVEHHKEMMVHAEEMARARRAVVAANLAGVPVGEMLGKKKK